MVVISRTGVKELTSEELLQKAVKSRRKRIHEAVSKMTDEEIRIYWRRYNDIQITR